MPRRKKAPAARRRIVDAWYCMEHAQRRALCDLAGIDQGRAVVLVHRDSWLDLGPADQRVLFAGFQRGVVLGEECRRALAYLGRKQ